MPTTRQVLSMQRDAVLAKLRDREPHLALELETLLRALRELPDDPTHSGPSPHLAYLPVRHAIDAIVLHLEVVGSTIAKDELAQGIVDGGWLRGNVYALRNAKGAIAFHLTNVDKMKKIKTFPSGRIGLYKWDDSRDKP